MNTCILRQDGLFIYKHTCTGVPELLQARWSTQFAIFENQANNYLYSQ